jgi:hypothetical protein
MLDGFVSYSKEASSESGMEFSSKDAIFVSGEKQVK